MSIKPKKYFGQHFLKDKDMALRIVQALSRSGMADKIIEIGPGTGILTRYLLEKFGEKLLMIDIDHESIAFLKKKFPEHEKRILQGDFLLMDPLLYEFERICLIGNFPYNISSQIFFKVLDNRTRIIEVVGMVQKEVGERISSNPGNKSYGILSVLLSAFYDIEYLLTVGPELFHPAPKVQSAVLRLSRNKTDQLACDEKLFVKIVKLGFQNRRKTLRNALKALNLPNIVKDQEILNKRAEQLTVSEYVELTRKIEFHWKN